MTDVEELAGRGVRAKVGDHTVCVGNALFMKDIGAAWHECHLVGTVIHVAVDGKYAGHIVVNDRIKTDSGVAVASLRRLGVSRVVMLSGDRQEVVSDVAHKISIDDYSAGLLPADKVEHVERLLVEKESGKTLAFVGDGINDAPVLKRADIGIAMGRMGSDAAIEAADVVIMDDNIMRVSLAVRIARKTMRIVHQNIVFAIGVKLAILALTAVGYANMWWAVFGDVGVAVIAILNAMRALYIKEER